MRKRREGAPDGAAGTGAGRALGAPLFECSREEVEALQRLAASCTAGIWRIKRAKIILGTLAGRSVDRLMWDVRVPATTVAAFQLTFVERGMAAFERPERRPTSREATVERMLAFLQEPAPNASSEWDELKVPYIGRSYSAREVARFRALVEENPQESVAALAREFCRLFSLYQATGRPRTGVATDVLRRMAMDNVVTLPALGPRRSHCSPTAAASPLQEPVAAEQTRHLRFALVEDAPSSRLWWDALRSHHYIKNPRLYGAQLRYLVYGSAGDDAARVASAEPSHLLAALGFASAAWRLTSRDEFIGWTDEQRIRNLKLVVGNARFLILPWVRVKLLASRILGGIARRLPADWQARYGFRPVLLETFVQLDRFSGTCYRAANWMQVGTTRGYSVYSSEARKAAPEKAVFMYPLRRDFRALLCDGRAEANEGASVGSPRSVARKG